MFNFISKILFKPSLLKCSLAFIIRATFLKSAKSKLLTPNIGYSLKKGIILFIISLKFLTWSKVVSFVSDIYLYDSKLDSLETYKILK